jgi:hypothetical protein
LTANTFPGASPIEYAFVGSFSISQAFFIAPVVTMLVRRVGTRPTLLIGVVFEVAGLVGASFSTKIWHLFLSQGIAFGW